MSKRDGGPAFPTDGASRASTYTTGHFEGMSLRDWFAGQALAGICGDGIPGSHHHTGATSRNAYDYADAMLKAREES